MNQKFQYMSLRAQDDNMKTTNNSAWNGFARISARLHGFQQVHMSIFKTGSCDEESNHETSHNNHLNKYVHKHE